MCYLLLKEFYSLLHLQFLSIKNWNNARLGSNFYWSKPLKNLRIMAIYCDRIIFGSHFNSYYLIEIFFNDCTVFKTNEYNTKSRKGTWCNTYRTFIGFLKYFHQRLSIILRHTYLNNLIIIECQYYREYCCSINWKRINASLSCWNINYLWIRCF